MAQSNGADGGSLEQAVKQRIVGTVVLLALGLLVVPVIFDDSAEAPVQIEGRIPAPPDTSIAPVAKAVAPAAAPEQPISEQFNSADQPPLEEKTPAVSTPTVATSSASTAVAAQAAAPAQTVVAETVVAPPAPAATPVANSTSASQSEKAGATKNSRQLSGSKPEAALASSGLPKGYVVQVGAFSSQENAEKLLARLKQAGHPAYIRRSATGAHVVLVGPHIEQAQAKRVAQDIKRQFGQDGLIKAFQP